LYVLGTIGEKSQVVALVGSRAASRAGQEQAFSLARGLAQRNVVVVSGGALGIDAAAHRGVLAVPAPTWVVFGCGIDVTYPLQHQAMYQEVLAGGGALVSMFPPGTEPRPGCFVRRNQLIAALADVVVVVEAEARSGALYTATAAGKLGRVVAATQRGRGCARLLDQGAALVETVDDIVAALEGDVRWRVPEVAIGAVAQQIATALGDDGAGVDALCERTGLGVGAVVSALSELESAGYVELLSATCYRKTPLAAHVGAGRAK
jgi:DNA processing protein